MAAAGPGHGQEALEAKLGARPWGPLGPGTCAPGVTPSAPCPPTSLIWAGSGAALGWHVAAQHIIRINKKMNKVTIIVLTNAGCYLNKTIKTMRAVTNHENH